MDTKAELARLNERALTLEDTIRDIDFQIEQAMHAVAGDPAEIGHAIGVVTERHKTQMGLMFELGKVSAHIEDLENRMREQIEQVRERKVAQDWESQELRAEDHLDWLRPALNAPEPNLSAEERHPHHDGEERMHREDHGPKDHLDWWKR